ncbi:hypothetical protein QBC46DRAFT_411636 [Diplogelasinospora grovesii]|uniref:Uncharacterized protein n=1 Tax=Diplogelasinospora grovesii TaxID=303347 RepID=A0AAN6N0S9_9PEZI|nr:hypothetical protein QBC46DRAFT_411636 [Diplogelasinospora grovesii]
MYSRMLLLLLLLLLLVMVVCGCLILGVMVVHGRLARMAVVLVRAARGEIVSVAIRLLLLLRMNAVRAVHVLAEVGERGGAVEGAFIRVNLSMLCQTRRLCAEVSTPSPLNTEGKEWETNVREALSVSEMLANVRFLASTASDEALAVGWRGTGMAAYYRTERDESQVRSTSFISSIAPKCLILLF